MRSIQVQEITTEIDIFQGWPDTVSPPLHDNFGSSLPRQILQLAAPVDYTQGSSKYAASQCRDKVSANRNWENNDSS